MWQDSRDPRWYANRFLFNTFITANWKGQLARQGVFMIAISDLTGSSTKLRAGTGATDMIKPTDRTVVYLLDDDPLEAKALSGPLKSLAGEVIAFGTAGEYLECSRTDSCACIVANFLLPDINGLELLRQLSNNNGPPIIFIGGFSDVPSVVAAMKAGAIEFLTTPVCPQELIAAVEAALAQDRRRRHWSSHLQQIEKRFSLLTPREREVLPLVAEGLPNKQAAAVLGISGVTLQVHRSQIMRKMAARSFADLVRMAEKLGIPAANGIAARGSASNFRSIAWGYCNHAVACRALVAGNSSGGSE